MHVHQVFIVQKIQKNARTTVIYCAKNTEKCTYTTVIYCAQQDRKMHVQHSY